MIPLTQQELDTLLKDVICVYVPNTEAFLTKEEFLAKYKTPIEKICIEEEGIPYAIPIYITYPEPRKYYFEVGGFIKFCFYRTKEELKKAVETLNEQIHIYWDAWDGEIHRRRIKVCRKANDDFELNIDFQHLENKKIRGIINGDN